MVRVPASCRSAPARGGSWWFAPIAVSIGVAWLSCTTPLVRAAEGLRGSSNDLASGWQTHAGAAGASPGSLSLFGDYYFPSAGAPGLSGGGFRATGGFFVGSRNGLGLSASGMAAMNLAPLTPHGFGLALPSAPHASSDVAEGASIPYVGVGYSGLKTLRATGGGWAFSADVGVMALQPRSAVRFGQQPVADTLRDLQFSPLLQLGASYAF